MWTREDLTTAMVKRLSAERAQVAREFRSPAETATRHCVIDDFLPESMAREIGDAFPADCIGFKPRADFRERKRTSVLLDDQAPILKEVTFAFQSPQVISEVGKIAGVEGLEPDPKLYAGGLSMMVTGDYLHPHIDNSHDSARKRYRRLNLLYYVSPDWSEACGGNFELWNARVTKPKVIVSRFNRLVIMETNRSSVHSVNEVRSNRPRCCVSNYFFSKESPTGKEYYHVTAFKGRPGPKRVAFLIDAMLRNVAAKTFGLGRGRKQVYGPQ